MSDKKHNCNNEICKLLNPSIETLLDYDDLINRIKKVEELFDYWIKTKDFIDTPIDLFGWCYIHKIYQLLNKEFIRELAKEIEKINGDIILEIGAGNGLLSKHLNKELKRNIIATDDYSWHNNSEMLKDNNVINMEYKNALEKFKPDLVIVSWIPYKRYWTKDIRETRSVKGYILIGEGRGGSTGCELDWITDWKKHRLENVEQFGICRTDYGFGNNKYIIKRSQVYYFEK